MGTLEGHTDWVNSAVFFADGTLVLTASEDRTAKIFNLETGEVRTLEGHTDGVTSAVFSVDGTLVLTASCDRTAKIFNLETGEMRTLEGHRSDVNSAAFGMKHWYKLVKNSQVTL